MNDFTNAVAWLERVDEYIGELRLSADSLTSENEFLRSLLSSFWTGDVPDSATLDHLILAKAGRIRLEAKSKVCSLLGG